jgi:centrin-1
MLYHWILGVLGHCRFVSGRETRHSMPRTSPGPVNDYRSADPLAAACFLSVSSDGMCASTQTVFLWTFVARQISMSDGFNPGETSEAHSGHRSQEPRSPKSVKQAHTMSIKSPVKLSQEQVDMIHEVFSLFDTDGEGQLQEDELAAAIFAMGFSTRNHHKLARDFVSQIDRDGDRAVSLEEFTELMKGQLAGRDPEEEIRATFHAFCDHKPSVRSIDLERLRAKARQMEVRLTDEEIRDMIADADRDGGGDVDEEEYVHILKDSTWF